MEIDKEIVKAIIDLTDDESLVRMILIMLKKIVDLDIYIKAVSKAYQNTEE